MSWATRFAIKTMVFGIGAVGMVAALSGKDQDSPQAQMMAAMRSPEMVCKVTPMPAAQCTCVVAAMADKTPMELVELQNLSEDDPRRIALADMVHQKCGHLAQAQ